MLGHEVSHKFASMLVTGVVELNFIDMQISVHTWSHHPLSESASRKLLGALFNLLYPLLVASLTNEQIVAELGWTMIAIKAVLGVTPNTMRPPYGDIDDRVRAIAQVMGLTPILWTGTGANQFDTDDWRIPGGTANGTSSYTAFTRILDVASQLATGFIVLEHDLYQQTVDMAIGYFLPLAKQRSFTVRKKLHMCSYLFTPGLCTFSTFPAQTHL